MRTTLAIGLALTLASISTASDVFAQGEAKTSKPSMSGETTNAAPPSPEKMEEARQRFQRGLQLFEEKNYEAARVELERAYSLAPTWKLLYNIGVCYSQRGDYVEALKDLERYLREGAGQISEERREEVNKEIANLKPRIAHVTVTTNVPDGDLFLDDQPIGKVAAEPIMVNPGKRKLSVTKPGYFAGFQVVEAAGSDKLNVAIDLKKLPDSKGTDLKPIIAWSVTGVLAVGAGITGYLTSRANKSLDDDKNKVTTAAALDDDASQVKTGALVTDILIAGTVVAAGVSVYFTWFHKDKDKEPEKEPARTVGVGFGPTGVSVRGLF